MPLRILVVLAIALSASSLRAQPGPATSEEWLARAQDVGSRGLMKQAIEFASKAIDADPLSRKALYYRATLLERIRQFAPAESDLSRAIALDDREPALFLQRGLMRLRLLDFDGAVADFDRYAALRPSRATDLWQRGIALFYAGRWDDARQQFEIHRLANPHDVENSAWHFACIAKLEGLEAARAKWMPVQGDRRIPMARIQELMQGTGSPEAVLEAAETAPESQRGLAQLYANLYLSLYHGATKDRTLEARHAVAAVRHAAHGGIMGDIARVHSDWVAQRIARHGE